MTTEPYAQYELPAGTTERDYPQYYCDMTLAEFHAALRRLAEREAVAQFAFSVAYADFGRAVA